MQWKRQQQSLTCNTPSSKYHRWCFITYSVLTGKKQQTLFKKKQCIFSVSLYSASYLFQIWTSRYLSCCLIISLFPLTKNLSCICTHENIFLSAESLNGSESTCLTPFCLSLLFHNNNSITQSELQFALRLFHSYISLQVA